MPLKVSSVIVKEKIFPNLSAEKTTKALFSQLSKCKMNCKCKENSKCQEITAVHVQNFSIFIVVLPMDFNITI